MLKSLLNSVLFVLSFFAFALNCFAAKVQEDRVYDVKILGVGIRGLKSVINSSKNLARDRDLAVGINFSQAKNEDVILDIKNGKLSDIIFFHDQKLLSMLKMEGLVNINYIKPIVFSDLVCIGSADCKNPKNTIFVYTSDGESFFAEDNSRALDSANFTNCNDLAKLHTKYQSILVEDFIAKSCNSKMKYVYKRSYKTYYMAVLVTENLKNAITAYEFFAQNIK